MRTFGFMGSSAVDINSLPNQKAVWDFSNVANVQTSSGNLDGATDLSGTGNNVTLSSNKPAYYSSGGQNNKGYIDLGASGEFIKTTITGISSSPATVYMVIALPNNFVTNQVLGELAAFPNADLVSRDTTLGFQQLVPTFSQFCQYTEPSVNVYNGVADIGDVSNAPARRIACMVVKWLIAKNTVQYVEINGEPFIDNSGLATDSSTTITKFSTRYANSKVYEVRLLTGIPSAANDIIMKQGLLAKYAITQPTKTMLVMGDSITAGTQSGTAGTAYIKSIFDNSKANAYNFAIPSTMVYDGSGGSVSQWDLESIYTNFTKPIMAGSNVLFAYGTNDAHYGYETVAAFKARYKSYIQAFITAGYSTSKIILATPLQNTGSYPGVNFLNYVAAIQQIASELGIVLCDFYAASVSASYDINGRAGGDNIHPDGVGNTLMYNTLYPLIA